MNKNLINPEEMAALAFLAPAAWFDFRDKLIPLWILLVGAGVDLAYGIYGFWGGNLTITGLLLSLLPGGILLLAALVSGGKAGLGDGFAFVLLGIPLGLELTFVTMVSGLLLMSLTGILLIILRRANKNTRMPFLPFCLVAYGGLLCVLR